MRLTTDPTTEPARPRSTSAARSPAPTPAADASRPPSAPNRAVVRWRPFDAPSEATPERADLVDGVTSRTQRDPIGPDGTRRWCSQPPRSDVSRRFGRVRFPPPRPSRPACARTGRPERTGRMTFATALSWRTGRHRKSTSLRRGRRATSLVALRASPAPSSRFRGSHVGFRTGPVDADLPGRPVPWPQFRGVGRSGLAAGRDHYDRGAHDVHLVPQRESPVRTSEAGRVGRWLGASPNAVETALSA